MNVSKIDWLLSRRIFDRFYKAETAGAIEEIASLRAALSAAQKRIEELEAVLRLALDDFQDGTPADVIEVGGHLEAQRMLIDGNWADDAMVLLSKRTPTPP